MTPESKKIKLSVYFGSECSLVIRVYWEKRDFQ